MKTTQNSSLTSNWLVLKNTAFAALMLLSSTTLVAQGAAQTDLEQIQAVEACIHAFATAADDQDIKGLEKVLHPAYRTVLNKAFGSQEVSLMSKDDYIGAAKAGKIGGSPRQVHILSLDIQTEVARATVVLQSEAMKFTSFMSMVRNEKGKWQMIEDLPQIEKL